MGYKCLLSYSYKVKIGNEVITSCLLNKYIGDISILLSELRKAWVKQAKILCNVHRIHCSACNLIAVACRTDKTVPDKLK